MPKYYSKLILATAMLAIAGNLTAQSLGDYRSRNTTGTWGTASSWEVLEPVLIVFTQWNVASSPPSGATTVYIRSGQTMNIDATAACNTLNLSGTVNMGSNTLTINGGIVNGGGSLVANGSSSLEMNGSGSTTLSLSQTTPGTSNRLTNLIINRGTTPASGNVTLGATLEVKGTITLSNGTLQTGGNLTLLSDATTTARIATIDTTHADISGNITTQRYIPGGDRDWRFLASPVTTSAGIQQHWQNTIFITGPVSGAGAICPSFFQNTDNGLDPNQSQNYSLFTYNSPSNQWVPVTNTITTPLEVGKGYRTFFRGNRSQGCAILDGTNATPQSAVLSATGTPGKGTIGVSLANHGASGWVLVGNPYPSSINWDATGWNTARISGANDIDNAIYIYNPSTNGYTSYVNGVSDGNGASNIISSGQGFFVKTNNNTSYLQFMETYKSSSSNNIFGKTQKPVMRLNLYSDVHLDVTCFYLDEKADAIFNGQHDALKFSTKEGSLASYSSNNILLSINGFSAGKFDTFNLRTEISGIPRDYFFSLGTTQLPGNIQMVLHDRFTGKQKKFSGHDSCYRFSVTTKEESFRNDRFYVVLGVFPMVTTVTEVNARMDMIKLYPNPLGEGYLFVDNRDFAATYISCYDLSGRQVFSSGLTQGTACEVDVSLLQPNLYYVVIGNDQEVISRSLLMRK